MAEVFTIAIFFGLFAVYDAIRRINNNILKQTEEIKKLREVFEEKSEK